MAKNEFIKIRVSAEQKAKWKAHAEKLGVSLTALLAYAVAKELKEDK